jgi:cobalt-zinc-cadmium efflux system outer membrane protein
VFRHPALTIALATITVALPGAALAQPSAAQEAPRVTLDEALRMLAENSAELRLARLRVGEAEGLARQSAAFPNPEIAGIHEPLGGEAGSYSETYLTASQRFDLSGARGARSEAGARRLDAALQLLRADSLRLAFEVKRTYVEALTSQEARAVTERIASVFRDAARSASERHGAGDISLYDLRRIQVERGRYETLAADVEIEVRSVQRSLALLVAPSGEELRLAARALPSETPPSVAGRQLDLGAAGRRAELAAARAEVQAAAARVRLTRAERVPDVTATAGFKRQSDGRRGAVLGLSAPLPLFDRGAGNVAAADAEARAAEERFALTRRQLEVELLLATERYEALTRRWELIAADGMAQDDDLLSIALVAYAEGEMDLVELLDAADAFHGTRLAQARLRAALWIAYFDLERAVGGFDIDPSSEVSR